MGKSNRVFISELEEGSEFGGVLLVKSARLMPTRTGGMYMDLELVDRTGRIKAKIWDASKETASSIPENAFMLFRGRVSKYRDELQLTLEKWQLVDESSIEMSDFMPYSRFPLEDLEDWLAELGQSLESEHYRMLWEAVLADNDFMDAFVACPAAVSYHHVFVGGLLEHTCEVIRICDAVAAIRPELSRDLLLTGALLHDCGKTQEYSQGPAFGNLDRGMMLGHIHIGTEMVTNWASKVEGFPEAEADLIKHMILSHHGTKEFGAPVEPACPEAIVIHHADNMDAKINNMRTMIQGDSDNEGGFTKLQSPMLRRRVLKTTLRPEPEGYNPFAKVKEQDKGKAVPGTGQAKQPGPQKPADPGASLF